jgi:hypothetical protein
MDANEPGLFDLPGRERPGTANRRLRGRNRETWVRTVTVEVTVIEAGALHEAVAQAAGSAVTTGLGVVPRGPGRTPQPVARSSSLSAGTAMGVVGSDMAVTSRGDPSEGPTPLAANTARPLDLIDASPVPQVAAASEGGEMVGMDTLPPGGPGPPWSPPHTH